MTHLQNVKRIAFSYNISVAEIKALYVPGNICIIVDLTVVGLFIIQSQKGYIIIKL